MKVSPAPAGSAWASGEDDDAEGGLGGAPTEEPRFRARQFAQQAPLQFLFPLSLPVALCVSRGFFLNAMGVGRPFVPSRVPVALLFLAVGLCPFVTVAAFALSPADADVWATATLRSDAIHVVVAYVSLRLAVTIKYAFLPPADYARRLAAWAPSAEL